MTALEVLSNHDEWHQKNLNHVGNKQPKRESGKWIKPEMNGSEGVPTQPTDRPGKNNEKKTHCTNVFGDPAREKLETA